MKDSSFGYSTLTCEESRRFQIAAHNYGQFQTLFGIDQGANVQLWEYGAEPVPDGQITARGFLDSLSTSMLHHIAIFKDLVLQKTDYIYREALNWRLSGFNDLSKGKYTDRYRDGRIPIFISFQNNTVTSSSLSGWALLDFPINAGDFT